MNFLIYVIETIFPRVKLSTHEYLFRARKRYDLKNYKGAIKDFTRVMKADQNYSWLCSERGLAKIGYKDYVGAISDFSTAIKFFPNHNLYHRLIVKKGNINYVESYLDGSISFESFLDSTSELASEDFKLYFNRGRAKSMMNDHKGAISDFDKVIELNESYYEAYLHKGNALFALGDYSNAITEYSLAIISSRHHQPLPFYNRGFAYIRNYDRKNALKDFKFAYELGLPQALDEIKKLSQNYYY